jgi:hypothetical protein
MKNCELPKFVYPPTHINKENCKIAKCIKYPKSHGAVDFSRNHLFESKLHKLSFTIMLNVPITSHLILIYCDHGPGSNILPWPHNYYLYIIFITH